MTNGMRNDAINANSSVIMPNSVAIELVVDIVLQTTMSLSHVQIKMYVKSFAAKTAKLLGTQQHTPILHIPKHVPCTLLKRIPSNHP